MLSCPPRREVLVGSAGACPDRSVTAVTESERRLTQHVPVPRFVSAALRNLCAG
jgi:hypothetical protein